MSQLHVLPQFPQSYWTATAEIPEFPSLTSDSSADVVIVGGGITGITAGYLLAQEGQKVILLEAGRVLNGTTGHTTAKITVQHGLIYDELIQHFGADQARLYYEANQEALNFIKNTSEREKIACELAEETAYLYASSEQTAKKLEVERAAYEKLGIEGDLREKADLPFAIAAALAVPNQLRFHPIPYLTSLIKKMTEAGSEVFEHTTAKKVEEGERPVVVTEARHRIDCRYVIAASHFPFPDWKGLYFTRMHAERSYVLAARVAQPFNGGMYISADTPTRSIRVAQGGEDPMILIGGDGHKAGVSSCTFDHYEALQSFAESFFEVKEIVYRWSTQDLVTLDKVPYVGRIHSSSDNILVATGYRKWGMTNGTAAAHMLKNIVLGIDDPHLNMFDSTRFHADPDIKTLLTTNLDVAKHLISGKMEMVYRSPDEVQANEGAVVRVNGKRAGAYRDSDGHLHLVDTTCTHLGCETNWNEADRTWDCPCHGSRFSYTGEVVEGPAKKPLKQVEPSK